MPLVLERFLKRVPDEAEVALLEQARQWSPHRTLDHLTSGMLAELATSQGVDFATAVAYDRVASDPYNLGVIAEITQWASQLSACELGTARLVIVPNFGYPFDGKSQISVERMRDAARNEGVGSIVAETSSVRGLTWNARSLCDTFRELGHERSIVASISKGSADLKAAFDQPDANIAFEGVIGWINICGLADGSHMVNLFARNEGLTPDQIRDWFRGLGESKIECMVTAIKEYLHGPDQPLGKPMRLPRQFPIINLVAFAMERHLTYRHSQLLHRALCPLGPNDGFGLLAEQVNKPGAILPIWGCDHYLDQVLDVEPLVRGILRYILALASTRTRRSRDSGGTRTTARRPVDSSKQMLDQRDSVDDAADVMETATMNCSCAKSTDNSRQRPAMFFARDGEPLYLGATYCGASAFLIGGGPSLKSQDLTLLQQRGILVCAMNNAATIIRPHLWVSGDDPGNFSDAIWRDPGILKFVPLSHMKRPFTERTASGELASSQDLVGDMPGVIGIHRNEVFEASRWLYEDTFNWGNQSQLVDALGNKGSRSIMLVAVRLLFELGIRRIFLLGCDFRMEYGRQNYAFAQERSRSSVRGNNSTYRILNSRFGSLVPYFQREGFQVFNCTPESGLTAFPSMSYEAALDLATEKMPPLIRTDGMYDRLQRERDAKKTSATVAQAVSTLNVTPSPACIPAMTLVVAVDQACLSKLKLTWPTWMHAKQELNEWPVLIIHDASINPSSSELDFLRKHRHLRFVSWELPSAETQREKMLTSLVHVPATLVETPWYLKLDVDVVATSHQKWIEPEWFQAGENGQEPAFAASPWGYTKPADTIDRLNVWGSWVGDLRRHPPLNLSPNQEGSLVRHPRIISWCFFGNTAWTREVAAYAPGRLPCPSHDTFLFYCAARRGDPFVRVHMSRYGWKHISRGMRRLKDESRRCLTQELNGAVPVC